MSKSAAPVELAGHVEVGEGPALGGPTPTFTDKLLYSRKIIQYNGAGPGAALVPSERRPGADLVQSQSACKSTA